ncbi:23S rRNA (guanosine(2251)-2'-O)-methyltransferase RlmB [Mycoplasma tauri]|uniref:23S rRNA (guanosine(2251)-2'-O)-methyltransferase RlmB n=1 Tax=Mycoplasma tauri TaxID=547987 RepID=UPI001CBBA64E|nr:23S rRNA (guanosine(2251)-2'-O)-methyltransferase RlmB [Mycoplasma tauri]MBZ4203981.1 23S rRNA (guanosine(2251)-2'-O)-methyltransferase RlmB [Mycoplasma tauri]
MKKLFICGKNSVIDAVKAKMPIENIYVNSEINKKKIDEISTLKSQIKDTKFFSEFNDNNHQGFIATLKDFPIYQLNEIEKDKPNFILILDHIQDPYNLGAIIRTANAAGIKHIILPKERSVGITPTVLKISSGGFIGMKIIKVGSLNSAVEKIKKMGYWIYASALNEKATSHNKTRYNHPCALVVGNEMKGVSQPILKLSDQVIYIKQNGSVQSLNVSVATGILLFEMIKKIEDN